VTAAAPAPARTAFGIFSRSGLAPSAVAGVAAAAEGAGYDTVLVTESYCDVFPYLVACARATRTVALGSAIANIGFRHPALMAMSAAATDEVSGGRLLLGLGVGTQWFTRDAADTARGRPVAAMHDYVALLRALWRGEPAYEGSAYRVGDWALDFRPRRPAIPVFLAALNEGMTRLAGAIADGVFLGALIPLDRLPAAIARVREGAHASGREPGAVTIAAMLRVCVDDDLDRAREGARATIPLYLTFAGYARYLATLGYEAVVRAVAEALARGDTAAALRQVPDELVERTQVYGDAARCRLRIAAYREAGCELPVVLARPARDVGWEDALARTLRALAPVAATARTAGRFPTPRARRYSASARGRRSPDQPGEGGSR
jgi:alkanesulfonate monooxygenase SsuD/methylene tetrahydromethanopterin reductase-like flavin-dependent oxidoreductase (luciferase family)